MKKLVVTILTLLTCGASYALPVGNPAEASLFLHGAWWDNNCGPCDPCDPCFSWCDAWSLRIGFYGDYIFNRHLKIDNGDDDGAKIDKTSVFTNAGYIALNICDRIDFFTTLGASDIVERTADAFGYVSAYYPTKFSWSVGARGTLWTCDGFAVGLEGQYFQFKPNFEARDTIDGLSNLAYSNKSVRYQDWQVGLGASYRFATSCPSIAMVPYVAAKWSGNRVHRRNISVVDAESVTVTLPNLKNDKSWGWAVGTTLTLCDVVGVTAEGRFGDEKAFYVNGQFRF